VTIKLYVIENRHTFPINNVMDFAQV